VPVLWVSFGVVVVAAAVRARRSVRALQVGLVAVAGLFVLAGALVNAAYLMRGDDYATFASGSTIGFVRDTWASLVVPHHHLFIGLLVAFEATVGVLVLLGPRAREVGLVAAIVFHVLLVSFGWGFALWSAPLVVALGLLLRASRRRPDALASWSGAPTSRKTPRRTLHGV
jgi:hypothetical protein